MRKYSIMLKDGRTVEVESNDDHKPDWQFDTNLREVLLKFGYGDERTTFRAAEVVGYVALPEEPVKEAANG